jgi:hypothetical protein
MSNNYSDILSALMAPLNGAIGVPTLMYGDNSTNTDVPQASDSFLAISFMPSNSESPTVSGAGHEIDDGFLQIMVATPKNKGAFPNMAIVDTIRALYPRYARLVKDDVEVNIRKVEVASGRHLNESHYGVPVSVYYRVVG